MPTLPGDVFAGAGETAALMRAKDWSATALGPIEGWPQGLKIVVRILLTSRYAMWLGWGPGLTFFYNDAYARMTLGPKHPWALGRSAREVWSEIWADIGPRIDSVLRTGEATWDERLLLFLERHGYPEETYHTFSYSPVFDDQGAVAGMLCVVTEDTDRVLDERRLRLLRELASDLAGLQTEQDLFDAACRRISSCPRDLPFTLTYLVEAGGRARLACATGVEPGDTAAPIEVSPGGGPWPADEALSGRTVTVEDLATRLPGLPAGPRGAAPRQAVVVPLAKQGSDAPAGFFVAGVNPFRRLDASYTGFLNLLAGQVASGLASARAAEAERKRAEALAELDRAKTAFFSNVSHEFRTPLTLMLGPVEDLLARPAGEPSPDGRASLEVVHRNGLRLLRLVNSLLDFSRIEAGRAQASYEPTDLAALTADLASNFRSACEKAGLSLVVDCPPLPEPVYVDRDLWEKVVLNLLSNAFKFTLQGEIRVTLRPAAGRAELEVRDTGTGIPQAELPHLFERFHRVEGARGRTQEGTGIGLALVQELVKLHGGAIRADSAPDRGTAFTVSLPLGSAHLPADRVRAERVSSGPSLGAAPFVQEALRWLPSTKDEVRRMEDEIRSGERTAPDPLVHPSPSTLHPSSRRPRVLLADDNLDMRDYVRRLLSAEYDVAAVADGRQALAAAQTQPPDLVISDVMMPHLDGFGLLRALRDDPRTAAVPVILLSARAGEEARIEGLKAGADDYLIKPFSAASRWPGSAARWHWPPPGPRRPPCWRASPRRSPPSMRTGGSPTSTPRRRRSTGLAVRSLVGRVLWEVFPEAVGTAFEREYRHAMAAGCRSAWRSTTSRSRPGSRWPSTRSGPAGWRSTSETSATASGPTRSASGCTRPPRPPAPTPSWPTGPRTSSSPRCRTSCAPRSTPSSAGPESSNWARPAPTTCARGWR
ncbi:MAG: ATP-binding protein [Gemmataceae bacterium]